MAAAVGAIAAVGAAGTWVLPGTTVTIPSRCCLDWSERLREQLWQVVVLRVDDVLNALVAQEVPRRGEARVLAWKRGAYVCRSVPLRFRYIRVAWKCGAYV